MMSPRGRESVLGNGTAKREAYIMVNDRRILYDTETSVCNF